MTGFLRGPGGKLLRGPGGKLTRDVDCCCCDCDTDGPTAGFSYTQTGDTPCAFDFTDESVAGDCGEIVEWDWDFDGYGTSSSQNPSFSFTGQDYPSGPWNVTLTVTDSAGCQDSVVMEVTCGNFVTSCGHTFFFPASIAVDYGTPGGGCPAGGADPTGGACNTLGGGRSLALDSIGTGGGSVSAHYLLEGPGTDPTWDADLISYCDATHSDARAGIASSCAGIGALSINHTNASPLAFITDWRGQGFTLTSSSGTLCSIRPASVSVST